MVIASAMFKKTFYEWRDVVKHSFVDGEVPKQSGEVPKEYREALKQSEILDGVKIVEIILEYFSTIMLHDFPTCRIQRSMWCASFGNESGQND